MSTQFPVIAPLIDQLGRIDQRWLRAFQNIASEAGNVSFGLAADIPQAFPGGVYLATDTGAIYISDATTWEIFSVSASEGGVLTGAVTKPADSSETTITPVFTSPGTYGSSSLTPTLTINAAGQVTGLAFNAITATATAAGASDSLQYNNGGVLGGAAITYLPSNQSLSFVTPLPTFNNLSPLTTEGDLLTHDGTNNVRLGIGAASDFLRVDTGEAAWGPLTSGDVVTALGYTPGTVSDVSVTTANGVSGSVATSTTTPAITLTLGAITPSSVAAVGTVTGSNLSGTNTGDQTITLTGNVTGSGTGSFATTIASNAVTNARLNDMATSTIKGRVTAGTGDPEDLTTTQATTLINTFTSTLKGSAPASGGGTTNFLRADGTWAVPPDAFTGTVTSVSVTTANGVSGSVATATTTPAITLSLGAITPTSVAASGTVTGSNLSGTNTGDQTITLTSDVTGTGTGSFATTIANNVVSNAKLATVATARIKGRVTAATGNVEDLTGTQATTLLDTFTTSLKGLAPASGGGTSNYLRADGTWASPPGATSGTVTSVSVTTANGVSGSVATATTTPAISLTLGAITPTSVAASGTVTGSNLSGTNTGDQTITLTSDVTGTGTGSFATTIANNVVTNAKLATVATARLKGRVTAATGNVEDLTGTQTTTLLDTFTSSLKGLAPASGGGTSNYLRADGTWASPPGATSGTVTSVSVTTANGVSGSVATATTTPAISLTLGDITPTSVVSSGVIKAPAASLINGTSFTTTIGGIAVTPQVQMNEIGTPIQSLNSFGNDNSSPFFVLSKSRGATVGSYGAVTTANTLGTISFVGSDAVTFNEGARIDAAPGATWSTTAGYNTVLRFYTTQPGGAVATLGISVAGSGYTDGSYTAVPLAGGTGLALTANITVSGGAVTAATVNNGGYQYLASDTFTVLNTYLGGAGSGATFTCTITMGSVSEKMRLSQHGNLGIGATGVSNTSLRIGSPTTGGVNSYGIYQEGVVQPDVTTLASIYESAPTVAASLGTLTTVVNFRAAPGATNSRPMTNMIGFQATTGLSGKATNTYGFQGALSSTSADTYNLMMSGTAPNYFAGQILQGTFTAVDMVDYSGTARTANTNLFGANNIAAARLSIGYGAANGFGPALGFMKTRSASATGFTVVSSGDDLGSISFSGADGAAQMPAASILAEVDTTPSTGIVPGRLIFNTSNASGVVTEAMRISSLGYVSIGTTPASVGGIGSGRLMVSGTDYNTSLHTFSRWSNDTDSPYFVMSKSRGATVGSYSVLSTNDLLGRIQFRGAGTSTTGMGAQIFAQVTATTSNTSCPTRLVFQTSAVGSVVSAERLRIEPTGAVEVRNGTLGYGSGAGGAVTQLTSKTTGVTLNTVCGQITTSNAAMSSGSEASFTLTNSTIAATDVVYVCIASGGSVGYYNISVDAVAAGSCIITIDRKKAGSLSEALVLNFTVFKGVNA